MTTSNNDLAMRSMEKARIERRMELAALQIDSLGEQLYEGSRTLPPTQFDELRTRYYAALRRYNLDEARLSELRSKRKLTDSERDRTQKKLYKSNYKY